ncbi:MAG: rRNA maturation RNase YbeY [Thermoanaerobaculia bacterium]
MIEVVVSGPAVPRLSRNEITRFVQSALDALRRARATREPVTDVSIHFVDDAGMKRLNGRFRGKKKTTDVLTFPAGDEDVEPGSHRRPLGDVVISLPQARRQARVERHSLATEVRYLILHGIIHALGYDHATDHGEMNALENRIRPRVGLE